MTVVDSWLYVVHTLVCGYYSACLFHAWKVSSRGELREQVRREWKSTTSVWNVAAGTEWRIWRSWRRAAKHLDIAIVGLACKKRIVLHILDRSPMNGISWFGIISWRFIALTLARVIVRLPWVIKLIQRAESANLCLIKARTTTRARVRAINQTKFLNQLIPFIGFLSTSI